MLTGVLGADLCRGEVLDSERLGGGRGEDCGRGRCDSGDQTQSRQIIIISDTSCLVLA